MSVLWEFFKKNSTELPFLVNIFMEQNCDFLIVSKDVL